MCGCSNYFKPWKHAILTVTKTVSSFCSKQCYKMYRYIIKICSHFELWTMALRLHLITVFLFIALKGNVARNLFQAASRPVHQMYPLLYSQPIDIQKAEWHHLIMRTETATKTTSTMVAFVGNEPDEQTDKSDELVTLCANNAQCHVHAWKKTEDKT